jgi:hypothetical protein
MKELLFRGLNRRGLWVYGIPNTYAKNRRNCIMITSSSEFEQFDFNTLGQYTGLDDVKREKIFDGDILEYEHKGVKSLGKIETVRGGFIFVRKYWWSDKTFPHIGDALADNQTRGWIEECCQVVGNVYNLKIAEKGKLND